MGKGTAYRKGLVQTLKRKFMAAGEGADYHIDSCHINKGCSVDLPELIGGKLRSQFLDRFFDKEFLVSCPDNRVFISGFKVVNFIDRYKPDTIFMLDFYPLQMLMRVPGGKGQGIEYFMYSVRQERRIGHPGL